MSDTDDPCDLYNFVAALLIDVCHSAYWYGEETGDYDMREVVHTDWFIQAVENIADACGIAKPDGDPA